MQKLIASQPIAFSAAVGSVLGLGLMLGLYETTGWYRAFIDWQLSHWQFFLPWIVAGIVVALLTDRD